MIHKNFLRVLCVPLLLSGCGALSPGRTNPGASVAPAVPRTVIVDGNRLKAGGKIFVKPFIPGEHVVSDDAFERVSMHVLKGFLVALQQSPEVYTLLGADQAGEAELLVEGRILEKKTRRVFEELWRRKTIYILKVEGSIRDREQNRVVMYFTHELTRADVEGFNDLAEILGQDIGRSVLMPPE